MLSTCRLLRRCVLIAALVLLVILSGCQVAGEADNGESEALRNEIEELQSREASLQARLERLESSSLTDGAGDIKVVVYMGLTTATEVFTVPVIRTPEGSDDLKEAALAELIRGPDPGGPLSPILPQETEVLSLQVDDEGLATVDFSDHIREYASGSTGETLVIAGIVHTLTEFPDVNRVQILVEGEIGVSLGGHFTLEEPIERMPDLIPN